MDYEGQLKARREFWLLAAMSLGFAAVWAFYGDPEEEYQFVDAGVTQPSNVSSLAESTEPATRREIKGSRQTLEFQKLKNPFTKRHESRSDVVDNLTGQPPPEEVSSAIAAVATATASPGSSPAEKSAKNLYPPEGKRTDSTFHLQGTASSERGKMAIIEYGGEVRSLTVGETFAGATLVDIGESSVRLLTAQGDITLTLPSASQMNRP